MSLPMVVAMLFQTGFSVIDMIFVGMSGAILTIAGQNYGADKLDRAQKTIRNSMLILGLFMLSVAGESLLFAEPIVSIFTQDAEVVALSIGSLYIRAPFWLSWG